MSLKKIIQNPGKLVVIFLLVLAIVVGNIFREKNYASVPLPAENADEYSFAWLGISLIKNQYPIAWSGISGYKKHDYQKINVDNIYDINPNRELFSIDKPWFDHPPLMGLLIGGYAYLKGVREFADASVIIIRRPMLKIAIINTILIFILATQLFGKKVGVLSSILYSLIPTIVISSRLALAENGYIPLFLTSLILAIEYFKKKKQYLWILATVIASIAVLFKMSALAIPLSLILLALFFGGKEKWKLVIFPVGGIIVSLGLFVLYGAYYDWGTFINVLKANSNRFFGAGSEIFYSVLTNPKIIKNYTDGWITAGLISFLITTFTGWKKDKNIKYLSIAVFSYFIIFLYFGSEPYGSYRFPFYPFFIISLSYLLVKLWEEPNILLSLMIFLLPLGTSIHRIVGIMGFQSLVLYFRLGVLLSLIVFAISSFSDKKISITIQRLFLILIFALLIFWSIKEIFFVNIDTWYFIT